jgi:hypothetical protein
MKKILFLILMIATATTLLANSTQKTFEDQDKLSTTQSLFDINDINRSPIKDIPVTSSGASSFNYVGFGASAILVLPIPIPLLNIGHREKYKKFAIDISLCLNSIIVSNVVGGNVKCLKYLNDTYMGGGINAGTSFGYNTPIITSVSPFFTIGKDKQNNFYEFDLSLIGVSNSGFFISPGVSFSYGYKF